MNPHVLSRILYPLTALIAVNTRLSLRTRKAFFQILLVSLPIILASIWRFFIYYAFNHSGDPFNHFAILCASMYMQFLVPLLALLKGMTPLSEEVEDGTLIYLNLRPPYPWVIVLGKYLSFVFSSGIILAGSVIITFVILGSASESNMLIEDLPILFKDLWVLWLGLAAYGAVMLLIGIRFKRPFITGILILFIWDANAAFLPGMANKLTVKHYLQSIFPHEATQKGIAALLSPHPHDPFLQSVLILCLIAIVCVALTTVVLRGKELPSGENAV